MMTLTQGGRLAGRYAGILGSVFHLGGFLGSIVVRVAALGCAPWPVSAQHFPFYHWFFSHGPPLVGISGAESQTSMADGPPSLPALSAPC